MATDTRPSFRARRLRKTHFSSHLFLENGYEGILSASASEICAYIAPSRPWSLRLYPALQESDGDQVVKVVFLAPGAFSRPLFKTFIFRVHSASALEIGAYIPLFRPVFPQNIQFWWGIQWNLSGRSPIVRRQPPSVDSFTCIQSLIFREQEWGYWAPRRRKSLSLRLYPTPQAFGCAWVSQFLVLAPGDFGRTIFSVIDF